MSEPTVDDIMRMTCEHMDSLVSSGCIEYKTGKLIKEQYINYLHQKSLMEDQNNLLAKIDFHTKELRKSVKEEKPDIVTYSIQSLKTIAKENDLWKPEITERSTYYRCQRKLVKQLKDLLRKYCPVCCCNKESAIRRRNEFKEEFTRVTNMIADLYYEETKAGADEE